MEDRLVPTARQYIDRQADKLGFIAFYTVIREAKDRLYCLFDQRLVDYVKTNQWGHYFLDQIAAGKLHAKGAETWREPYGKHPAAQITICPAVSWPFPDDPLPEGTTHYADIDLDESAFGVDVASSVKHIYEAGRNHLKRELTKPEVIWRLQDMRFGKVAA